MMNPVRTTIPQPDGSHRYVIIEPIHEKDGEQGLRSTGIFKIYKDALGDETNFFTEPLESEEAAAELPDEQNPDYLGKFMFANGDLLHFEGSVLNFAEQAYLAAYIASYVEPDI